MLLNRSVVREKRSVYLRSTRGAGNKSLDSATFLLGTQDQPLSELRKFRDTVLTKKRGRQKIDRCVLPQ